ncbi:MAG: hypothetical protein CVU07_12725, partial [Bacteroidetes bacterium HGW-Bacteroidetes-23]
MAALDYIYTKNAALLSVLAPDIREQVAQAYQNWVTESYLSRVEGELAAAEIVPGQDGQGDDLIFLLALPWSGASLLQQVLSRHAQIQAVDEAGVLLPLIEALKTPNQHPAVHGLRGFIDSLPDGEESYRHCVRQFAGELYRQALVRAGKRICLDRTSAYVEHIAEIRRLFPKAR